MTADVTVTIPAELAARIRICASPPWGASVWQDLAALLPDPDPLDVLAAADGWKRTTASGGLLSRVEIKWEDRYAKVELQPAGGDVVGLHADVDRAFGDSAAAVRLARALRAAIEDAE